MRSQALVTLDELRRQLGSFDEATKDLAAALIAQQSPVLATFRRVLGERLETVRIRCHGDFHLQQVLFTGKDFVIIDFEGDARDPLSERRIKRSPLRDVASMMRSIDYVARAALAGLAEGDTAPRGAVRAADRPRVAQWNPLWVARVTAAYLEGYEQQPGIAALLPPHRSGLVTLLETFLLERSLADLEHELRERPAWVPIALEGVLDVLADSRSE
jgi:maltose alpha-D-glucosyltransferase/alpha-amylase